MQSEALTMRYKVHRMLSASGVARQSQGSKCKNRAIVYRQISSAAAGQQHAGVCLAHRPGAADDLVGHDDVGVGQAGGSEASLSQLRDSIPLHLLLHHLHPQTTSPLHHCLFTPFSEY